MRIQAVNPVELKAESHVAPDDGFVLDQFLHLHPDIRRDLFAHNEIDYIAHRLHLLPFTAVYLEEPRYRKGHKERDA
ncbi:MAG: hypothetical protein ACLQU1_32650 [Bryobacteraceae bacterium]